MFLLKTESVPEDTIIHSVEKSTGLCRISEKEKKSKKSVFFKFQVLDKLCKM